MAKKEKMNKHELVRILAQKTGLTIKDIEEVVIPALQEVMVELAKDDRDLVLNGVAKAKVHRKKGRKGTLNGVEFDNTGKEKVSGVMTFPIED